MALEYSHKSSTVVVQKSKKKKNWKPIRPGQQSHSFHNLTWRRFDFMDFVEVSYTFCLGWFGEDTTTVLQMVRAMKKSMMSARSEGSWDMGWLWKRMKSIWLLHSLTLSRSWGSGVISFSCGTEEGLSVDSTQRTKVCEGEAHWPWGYWRLCAWTGC